VTSGHVEARGVRCGYDGLAGLLPRHVLIVIDLHPALLPVLERDEKVSRRAARSGPREVNDGVAKTDDLEKDIVVVTSSSDSTRFPPI
jgi:hypothetical protein